MTEDTLYAMTGKANIEAKSNHFTYSTSPYNRKIYAIKCDHGISSTASTKVRL